MSAPDILAYLNAISGLLSAIEQRGISRDATLELLIEHEGGDIPTETVQALLDESGGELDDTQAKILDKMTVAELKEFAAEKDIDLAGATVKADIRAAIDAALAAKDEPE